MLLNGKKPGLNVETIVLPRGDDEPIVFTAKAVLDMSQFERLCKEPTPPVVVKRTGERVEDEKDPKYLKALDEYGRRRIAFMVLKSLEDTEGLEWETVNMGDPATWNNYEKEFQEAGISTIEINRIISGVLTANCLNENRLKEARDHFLAGRLHRTERNGSSPDSEKITITSGEPVKDSA
jgi:hypothetical protein